MSQKDWSSRTWWTSLLCLATHCKTQMWNKSFDFSQYLKMWLTEAIKYARVQRLTHLGRPFCQHEPKLTRLALKPMKGLGLTAIPEWQRLWLCIDEIERCICPSWRNFEEKGIQRIHSARHQFAKHEVLMEVSKNRQRPWRDPGAQKKNFSSTARGSEWKG